MYTLQSAIGIKSAAGSRWEDISIGTMPVNEIFSTYRTVYARLTNNFYSGYRTLDFADIKSEYSGYITTFNQFLIDLGSTSLPVTSTSHTYTTKYAKYADGFRARYKVTPISPTAGADADILESEKTWLSLTKDSVDYSLFYKSCLVSVNGFVHLTDTNGSRIYVSNGMTTCLYSGRNQIGIHSFENIGELTFKQITEDMIITRNSQPTSEVMYIQTAEDMSGYLPILVLGGYVHIIDPEVFRLVGERTYAIYFSKIPLTERYFESKDVIDLSSLGLDRSSKNDNLVNVEQLHSDAVLRKYVQLPQSFLAFLKIADETVIYKEYKHIPDSKFNNQYTTYIEPMYPIITGFGKYSDYWRVYEDGRWSVTMWDAMTPNFLFETTNDSNIDNVDGSTVSGDTYRRSNARFMLIGADVHTSVDL